MNSRTLVTLLFIASVSASFCDIAVAAEKPNILVIVSDDHGYADVGFQGCKVIQSVQMGRWDILAALKANVSVTVIIRYDH